MYILRCFVVYGMANCDQWFPYEDGVDYKKHNDAETWYFSRKVQCAVDMCLDLDKYEIKWSLVGVTGLNGQEAPKLFKLPKSKTKKYGWVPHINVHDQSTEIRVASIPIEQFGIPNEHIFKRE